MVSAKPKHLRDCSRIDFQGLWKIIKISSKFWPLCKVRIYWISRHLCFSWSSRAYEQVRDTLKFRMRTGTSWFKFSDFEEFSKHWRKFAIFWQFSLPGPHLVWREVAEPAKLLFKQSSTSHFPDPREPPNTCVSMENLRILAGREAWRSIFWSFFLKSEIFNFEHTFKVSGSQNLQK